MLHNKVTLHIFIIIQCFICKVAGTPVSDQGTRALSADDSWSLFGEAGPGLGPSNVLADRSKQGISTLFLACVEHLHVSYE